MVLSDAGGAHAEVAAVLQEEFARDARVSDWVVAPWQAFSEPSLAAPQFMVLVGTRALAFMAEKVRNDPALSKVPMLATLLPKASFDTWSSKLPGNLSAVLLDQPVERSVALVRQTMPDRQNLGVLFGPESEALKPAVLKAAAAQGMTVHHASVYAQGDDIYPALKSVLSEAQVLLAVPDGLVFNPSSLQNILITVYRQRIPLIGYSAAHVKAGATFAVFATPKQMALQTSAAMRSFLSGRGLPPPRGADKFTVAVNAQVGRSLGLAAFDPDVLAEALRRLEETR